MTVPTERTPGQGAPSAEERNERRAIGTTFTASGRWRWLAVALAVVTAIAFLPVLGNGFVAWDDNENFLENPDFRGLGWKNVRWAWTTFLVGVYQPLGWMMLEAQYVVWGMKPLGYHLVSMLFHVIIAVVLLKLTLALLGWISREDSSLPRDGSAVPITSALAVALFAVHPLRVEDVAWASCQTYLPGMLFAMLTVLTYLRACDAGSPEGRSRWLAWNLFVYALALFTKAVGVSVPFVLLILDVYPLRRIGPGRWTGPDARRVYLEKVPFLALSLIFMVVAVLARRSYRSEHSTAVASQTYDIVPRIAQACYGIWFYPTKTLLPFDVSAYYPLPPRREDFFRWPFAAAAVATVIASAAAFGLRRRWPGLPAAMACYLVCLAPYLGLVRTGAYIAADRYGYVASMSGVVVLSYALARLARRPGAWRLAVGIAMGLIVGLSVLTWRQCLTWRTPEALWTRAFQGGPDDPAININLGIAKNESGRPAEAKFHFLKVLKRNPDHVTALVNLGGIVLREGKTEEAEAIWNRTLALDPRSVQALTGLGLVRARQGLLVDAERWHRRALRVDPSDAVAHNDLGVVLARQGDYGRAAAEFAEAARIKPDYAEARHNLGRALAGQEKFAEALAHYRAAIQLRPGYAKAHEGMGSALVRLGRYEDAAAEFKAALRADPNHLDARHGFDELRKLQADRDALR